MERVEQEKRFHCVIDITIKKSKNGRGDIKFIRTRLDVLFECHHYIVCKQKFLNIIAISMHADPVNGVVHNKLEKNANTK